MGPTLGEPLRATGEDEVLQAATIPGYGERTVHFDARARNWLVRDLLRSFTSLPAPIDIWQPLQPTLDQEESPNCVPFAVSLWIGGEPYAAAETDEVIDDFFAQELSAFTRRHGRIRDGGIYISQGMHGAVEDGWCAEYWWCGAGSGTPVEDVVDSIHYIGGVIIGVNWRESMITPRPSGLLEVEDGPVIGHACYLTGVRLGQPIPGEGPEPRDVVILQNTQGPGFGHGGLAYLALEDLDMLLEDDGEAVVPVRYPLVGFWGKDFEREKIGLDDGEPIDPDIRWP